MAKPLQLLPNIYFCFQPVSSHPIFSSELDTFHQGIILRTKAFHGVLEPGIWKLYPTISSRLEDL